MKTLETFYGECIDSKVVQCDLKARANGRSHCTKSHAELRLAQATFLEDQKERLVREMVKENLGKDLSRINTFLNESFFLAFRARLYFDGSAQDSEGMFRILGCSPCAEAIRRKMREPVVLNNGNGAFQANVAKLYELPWSDGSLIADENEDEDNGCL